MDWTLCIICQKSTNETLRCPLKAPGSGDKSQAYSSFLKNVSAFRTLNQLPVQLPFGDEVTVDTLVERQAHWHKYCLSKFASDKLDRATRKRKSESLTEGPAAESSRARRQCPDKNACIFCQKGGGQLHEFRTYAADQNVRTMALDLQDTALLSRIEGGDLVAIDAKYHFMCLTSLRNRHRSFMRQHHDLSESADDEKQSEARAFVELITYIESSVEDGIFCFKFSELRQLYVGRLAALGFGKEVNKVRFREQIMRHFPDAQEQNDGKNWVLVFQQGMQQMLKQAIMCDYEEDALILAKAAKIVRRDMMNTDSFHFNGSFPPNCQQQSVPVNLIALVAMLLYGGSIMDQSSQETQACLTIAQTIFFNSKSKKKTPSATSRHSLQREPPLPIYIGMNIHTQTRSKTLITQLYDLGICVSYDRILQLESQLATAVCQDYERKGVVCPAQMRFGLFTVGAIDNIDHNPSSSSAKGSFHGTGISQFQFPTKSKMGTPQDVISLCDFDTGKAHQLPEDYATVPAVALNPSVLSVPENPHCTFQVDGHLQDARRKERDWFEHALKLIEAEELSKGDSVAWAAYHASLQQLSEETQVALTQMFPLFYEKAATAAMIMHGMNVHRCATDFLNPGQVPVMAFDAPLFALAKFVQWRFPETHGEDKYVTMLGGLHIEMAIWNTVGDYLEGSGWTNVLAQAGIASSGTAESFLTSSHVTRTRHSHQVSALSLAKLQDDAFRMTEGPHDADTMDVWRQDMITKSPTFQYWDTILDLEITGLIFVRAHRERDFQLYVEVLKVLAPWFFSLDHQNYARWVPIHIRDMETLPPSILTEFQEHGNWVVPKTLNRFSTLPIDQSHEQNNEIVKGPVGIVGLTENPSAFRKWMVAGPEQGRILTEFEKQYEPTVETGEHHEEGMSTQKTFKEQVVSLVQTITDLGNPFTEQGPELLRLDTHEVMDESVVNTVRNIEALGKEQFKNYHQTVIVDHTRSIHQLIKKNLLPLFKCPKPKAKTKEAGQITMLKNDVALFSRLYIVMKHRDCDMDLFFQHENHPYPPSISDSGKLRQGKKSDLLTCLSKSAPVDPPASFDAKILDGAAVVHQLNTGIAGTFHEYASLIFIPHILAQLGNADRVDVVWDTYVTSSIKQSTREKRGQGTRRKVAGQTNLPGNWKDFLRDSTNKEELFAFLSAKVTTVDPPDGKVVIITDGKTVVSRGTDHQMPDCDHEEADTRLLVHLQDALEKGCNTCMVRTVDTDVLVIIIGQFYQLINSFPDADIWVAFGSGKHFTYIHVNTICLHLGEAKSVSLPVFHGFTGSDTTSAFFGRGKKLAWDAWNAYSEVTDAFMYIALHPFTQLNAESRHFKLLERFTVVLYDKTSESESINVTRKELFCRRNKTMEHIPPTQDALLQHTKRVIYQAGIWTTSYLSEQHVPSPDGWGWTWDERDKRWIPVWCTIPLASKACTELLKCGCKRREGCGTRCVCKKAQWKCTELCSCNCVSESAWK